MLRSVRDLVGYTVAARDGRCGELRDMYFDDRLWILRYWEVDAGAAASALRLSPQAVTAIADKARQFHVRMCREQLQRGPGVDSDPGLTHPLDAEGGLRRERDGGNLWSLAGLPLSELLAPAVEAAELPATPAHPERFGLERDLRLRSSAEVIGYGVAARDGPIGHVADFLIEPATWQVRMVVVDTHTRLADRPVLLPPMWVDDFDDAARQLRFRVSRDAVQSSPHYEASPALAHEQALRVQRHFEGWI
jgi:hypothetical protein